MPNTPDDPSSSHPRPTDDPAAHLVCAYSPRWLSGPTPAFDGLVATWSASEEAEPSIRPGGLSPG
jgi:hypothetical protein